MNGSVGGTGESLSSRDTQIAQVHVSDLSQARDDRLHLGDGSDDDIDVENRLGRQARDGRAADVLHRKSNILNRSQQVETQTGEVNRPGRVVIHDLNWFARTDRHGLEFYS